MPERIALVFAALLLFASLAFALPDAPKNISASFVGLNSVRIEWQHPSGSGVSFNIYRDASLKATVSQKFFVDSSISATERYVYFVTAVDSTGESERSDSVTVEPAQEKPFGIALVSPQKRAFGFGEEVEFVVAVDSNNFGELQDLQAFLINQDFGIKRAMAFDSERKAFVLSEKLPEGGKPEGFSTIYTIKVSAIFSGESFQEIQSYVLVLVPVKELDIAQLAQNIFGLFSMPFLLLMVASTVAFVFWRWAVVRKAQRDMLRLELLELHKEHVLWKHEVFKRHITPEQFREKEGELQGKQAAIEEKLGMKIEKGVPRQNPFEGFAPEEAEETMLLVKSIGKPKPGETIDSLRARLVGIGKSEKVAKKVAELVFRK